MKPTHRLFLRIVVASVTLVACALLLTRWWIARPQVAADRFIDLVSQGRFEEANSMVTGLSSIHRDDAGSLVIGDNAGNASVLNKSELPLMKVDSFYFQPRPTNLDYVAGRYHFLMISSGADVQSELKEPLAVLAISTHRGIVISSVR